MVPEALPRMHVELLGRGPREAHAVDERQSLGLIGHVIEVNAELQMADVADRERADALDVTLGPYVT
jgi:hypothetical protein